MKTCNKCGAEKLLFEFSRDKYAKDGLKGCCKSCAKNAYTDWVKNNPEKRREFNAAWYAKNQKTALVKKSEWRMGNIEKARANYAEWALANPQKRRIINHNYRARERNASGRLSHGLFDKLFALQRGKCACCGDDLTKVKPHMDHITALVNGGANVDSNIQLLCQRCNNQKYTKHPVDFMRQRGFLI